MRPRPKPNPECRPRPLFILVWPTTTWARSCSYGGGSPLFFLSRSGYFQMWIPRSCDGGGTAQFRVEANSRFSFLKLISLIFHVLYASLACNVKLLANIMWIADKESFNEYVSLQCELHMLHIRLAPPRPLVRKGRYQLCRQVSRLNQPGWLLVVGC